MLIVDDRGQPIYLFEPEGVTVRDHADPGRRGRTTTTRRASSRVLALYAALLRMGWLYPILESMLATILALRVVGRVDHALLLWPLSGVALANCLPVWNLGWKKRSSVLVLTLAGFLLAAFYLRMPPGIALQISLLTCVDVVIAGSILGSSIRSFHDLKHQRKIIRFLAAVALTPLVTSVLAAYPLSLFLRLPLFETGEMYVMANSLGMAVVIPALLLLKTSRGSAAGRGVLSRGKVVAAGAFFLAVTGFVFWQHTHPISFIILPPMIMVVLVMGLEGSVFFSLSLLTIGFFATTHGHGPILLLRDATPLQHLLLLQEFCWVCLATVLPIGALLDERKAAEREARESQSIYQILLQNVEDLIVLSAIDGSHRYVSPAITRLTGWTAEEYLALKRFETVHPDDRGRAMSMIGSLSPGHPDHTFRYRMLTKGGAWKWVETTLRSYGVTDDSIAGYVGTVRDISTHKASEEGWINERRSLLQDKHRMAQIAGTDALTGVLNRRGLEEELNGCKTKPGFQMSFLLLDIDLFKQFNDRYGHLAGDVCLTEIAEVLQSIAKRAGDLVARLGGEEFGIALPGTDFTGAMLLADRIQTGLLHLGIEHRASKFGRVTLSIGVASMSDFAVEDFNLLYSQADTALYVSKQDRNSISSFEQIHISLEAKI